MNSLLEWSGAPVVSRRSCIVALAAMGLAQQVVGKPRAPANLLASWRSGQGHHLGLVAGDALSSSDLPSVVLPTRAHGLLVERSGSILALARRPGDWLLRWHPFTGAAQWQWMEGDRQFNGHAWVGRGPGGKSTLWTTETDLATAEGLLGVRSLSRLSKHSEWKTHGRDPHALLALPRSVGRFPRGTLLVANGGIATFPETGRVNRAVEQMDASLVALSPSDGRLLGQWHLADPFLSVRHLAWNPISQSVGIALQAHHPDLALREAAPVFSVWAGKALVLATNQPGFKGYGGDICALPSGGFVVSCPQANALASFTRSAAFEARVFLPKACALAASDQGWWAGGGQDVLEAHLDGAYSLHALPTQPSPAPQPPYPIELDNHWAMYQGAVLKTRTSRKF